MAKVATRTSPQTKTPSAIPPQGFPRALFVSPSHLDDRGIIARLEASQFKIDHENFLLPDHMIVDMESDERPQTVNWVVNPNKCSVEFLEHLFHVMLNDVETTSHFILLTVPIPPGRRQRPAEALLRYAL
jgi:hypothetical protein